LKGSGGGGGKDQQKRGTDGVRGKSTETRMRDSRLGGRQNGGGSKRGGGEKGGDG